MMILEHPATTTSCDRESRITKSLLGYGVIAGPVFVLVSLGQALTRPGFDPARHAWSLLSNGDLGWIQVTNFVAAGLMTVALAVGLRRAGAGTWAPRLIGVYGLSLVAAGVFQEPLKSFVLALLLARSLRYFGEGFLAVRYGPDAIRYLAGHRVTVGLVALALVLAGYLLSRVILPPSHPKS